MTGPSIPNQKPADVKRVPSQRTEAGPAPVPTEARPRPSELSLNRDWRAKALPTRDIIGQADALTLLLTLGNQHRLDASDASSEPWPNRNVLLIGPPGSGKTCIPKAVCAELGIPLAVIDSTDFAPPGSRLGRSLDEVFAEMLRAAGHNLRMAERGALLLEDLDKLAQGLSPDVSRHLQQAWLRFMDGRSGTVAHAHGTGHISSNRWWVIATGTFDDLERAQAKRASGGGIGFSSARVGSESKTTVPADLVACGLTPGLIGRFPFVCKLAAPTLQELVDATCLDNSAVGHWARQFRRAGIELNLTDDARWELANQARQLDLGVRGLGVILSTRLTALMACLPELRGRTRRVIVRSEHLKGGIMPEIVFGDPHYPLSDGHAQMPPTPDDEMPAELAQLFPQSLLPKRPARVSTSDSGGNRLASLEDLQPYLEEQP